MEPGSVGTSLHFDGREVQNLQELEYQKEEEQQQCELRQMLTNAFDSLDEDILSETSEECESHDGSSYKPDSSLNNGHGGDGIRQHDQKQNVDLGFYQTQNQNGNLQQQHPNENPQFLPRQLGIPETVRHSYDFQEPNFVPTQDNEPDHQYSSLPTSTAHVIGSKPYQGHGAEIATTDIPQEPYSNPSQDYYTKKGHGSDYLNYYRNTPEMHPQPNENAYFTENRYTLEGRSSLDISYPPPVMPNLERPIDNTEFVRCSLDFNQHYNAGNYQFQMETDNKSLPRRSIEDFQNQMQQFQRESQDLNVQYSVANNINTHSQLPQQYTNNFIPQQNTRSDFSNQIHTNKFDDEENRQYQNGVTPGNFQDIPYKVQYINNDDSIPKQIRNVPEPHILEGNTDEIQQLKVLNKARIKESEDLVNKIDILKLESSREIRVLKHQMMLLEEEKNRIQSTNKQYKESNHSFTEENANLKRNLQRLEKETTELKDIKEELTKKLSYAETNIENLNMQIIELQLSDTKNRERQQNEMMITGLQQKFDQERFVLTEKLDKVFEVITEKEEAIDSLNKELQEERIKASLLEKNESLRGNGQEMYNSLQLEVKKLKEQMSSSKSASRLGTYSKSTQMLDNVHDDSIVELGIRKTLHFMSTPNISQMDDHVSETVMRDLRNDLERCHETVKKQEEMIERLQRDLTNSSTHVDILRQTLESSENRSKEEKNLEKRMEEMVEHEEKLTEINNELSRKLATHEDERKNLVEQSELDKAFKELDNIKEMYVNECEEREKEERKHWEQYEEKFKKTSDAFIATEMELESKIQSLQNRIRTQEETIKDLELKHLTAKYSKDKLDSNHGINTHNITEKVVTKPLSNSSLLNNLHEKQHLSKELASSDDSRGSENLNNSLLKNLNSASTDSFEKSDDSLSSNKSRRTRMTEKVISDIKEQHHNEIDYVRQILIDENKKVSIELHQKMMDMRQGHKEYIKKMKQDFRLEKEAMISDFEKMQESYLSFTKPNAKLVSILQSQYLEAVTGIRNVVLQHVREMNLRTAEKIKFEFSQERKAHLETIRKSEYFDGTLQDFL